MSNNTEKKYDIERLSLLSCKLMKEFLYELQDKGEDIENIVLELNDFRNILHIKNFDVRVDCFLKMFKTDDPFFDYQFLQIFTDDVEDEDKMKYLNLFNTSYYMADAISNLKNDNHKIRCLNLLDDYSKDKIISTIKNEEVIMDYYKSCSESLKFNFIKSISIDSIKEKYLNDFSLIKQVDIIETINDDLIVQKYAVMPKYSNYRSRLISKVKDRKFIIEYFKTNNVLKFRLNLISKVRDSDLQRELVALLDANVYHEILDSNDKDRYIDILNNINLDNIDYDVDKDITIGIELEACSSDASNILLINNILKNWDIKRDGSVSGGLEITSPVLHFDEEGIKEIFYICEFMKANKFYTNSTCGGHIHLGFNYIKTIEEFRTFINLYVNIEDLLYVICNKAGIKCRKSVYRYAKPVKSLIKSGVIGNIDLEKIQDLDGYTTLIKEGQPTRYYGLNLQNIGKCYKNTLEFRLPNGEIDFNELLINIRLFTSILSISKKIANNPSSEEKYLYDKIVNESLDLKEKLSILLELLNVNEKTKENISFRYHKNHPLIKSLYRQNPIKLK